ncbi:putative disease resistance protein RGA3 isoform X2 [Phoenix dactylifera]|uniref:Disease resistance protein RGA3 isoform X2 n=1 Tax=Phoenix dactylifera TaxID=42345 RepID=A0A8B8ZZ76_PHODC|nr:putative disease resistance protein RGA3 isoform X2 [Phoenix dactylifera]
MASAFLSSILSKTSQVWGFAQRSVVSPSSSSDPRSSVLEDLKELKRTLERIRAVLHDAEEREIRDESVKLWLRELKEVAYDADDVLDEYQYEVLRAQVEGRASRKRKRVEGDDEEEVSGSLSTIVVSIPDGMGDRIRKIRERFNVISQHRESLRLREEDGERRAYEAPYPVPTSHMVDESSIYGRERDKQKVIDLLFSEGVENGVSVIPIVGKGGLGKTTIAQLVYNDSKVKEYFDLTGWVCVSNDFDVPRLTKAIIESLTRSSCDLTQLSTLQDTLKEKLKGKRVLLVLDDVWNEQQSRWESLRNPFVGAEIVRIIMTCRNNSVAEIMQTVCPYHPGCLSQEQSWSLFRHYAFGGRDPEEQSRLTDMGKHIVKKCSGLPLAVKSIGSLLRYMADEDSWMDVMQSDIWEVDENNEILPALRLSYSRMPAHLKPCFVYCSMFPKDSKLDKYVLIRLWMAQGYIPSGGRRRMEDIGNEYFKDLQRRSFFDSYYSKFKVFTMHDLIHDLAKSIAGNECWAIVDKKLPDFPGEVRHLYVEDEEEFVNSLRSYNFNTLRTLLLQHQYRYRIVISEIIKNLPLLRCLRTLEFCWEREDENLDLLDNLKHLRYLCIVSNIIGKLPESICLLYHLQTLVLDCPHLAELPYGLSNLTNVRYLRITSNKIKKLPKSICLLYHLQTLVLHCRNLAELPDGLGNLTNLHHLQIVNRVILYLPAGIEKLTNLQSLLGCYKVQGGIGEVLKDLVNLRTLIISGLRNVVNIEDARDADLKYKYKLEKLFLHWNAVDFKNDPHNDRLLYLEAFPEENKDVPANEKREEAMLEYLQPHANLKKLVINGYGGSKFPEWVGDPLSFASLQEIYIKDCEKIRSLALYIHDSLGNLDAPISTSMLEWVNISGCRQLTSIAGLHHVHLLKYLKIYNCPKLWHLSEEGLPTNLQGLHIKECQQLTSLPEMQNLTSLKELIIQNCPKLQIMAEDQLSSVPYRVEIVDCPGLNNWCQIQRINCIMVASGNKLTISNTWEKIMHWFDDLTSAKHLCFSNSWKLFWRRDSVPIFEELTIWCCTDIPQLLNLPTLRSLQSLVIKDIPGIHCLPSYLLSSTFKSLVVDSCEDLTFLPLAQRNRDSFEELQLVNCPKLERVEGMNCLYFLKILRIEQCPQLRLPQDDRQPSIPPCVEDQLSSMPDEIKIVDCPGLGTWCQIQRINCILVASGNKLTLSNTWEKIMHWFHDLTSIEHPCVSNSWEFFRLRDSIPVLEELIIWACTKIPPLRCLPKLTSLRSLVIKDCPGVQVLEDKLLPFTLKSLVVDSCENLKFLLLAQQNRDAFEELQLVNCPKLIWVEGLNCLFFPKILIIERCPELQLPQDDRQPSIPPHVEIAGK